MIKIKFINEPMFAVIERDFITESEDVRKNLPFYITGISYPLTVIIDDVIRKDFTTSREFLAYLKQCEINEYFNATSRSILVDIPETEIKSWTTQEKEARAWNDDNTVSTPMIDRICAERNLDKSELVSRILAKADIYNNTVGTWIGQRQKKIDTIEEILGRSYPSDGDDSVNLFELANIIW